MKKNKQTEKENLQYGDMRASMSVKYYVEVQYHVGSLSVQSRPA